MGRFLTTYADAAASAALSWHLLLKEEPTCREDSLLPTQMPRRQPLSHGICSLRRDPHAGKIPYNLEYPNPFTIASICCPFLQNGQS